MHIASISEHMAKHIGCILALSSCISVPLFDKNRGEVFNFYFLPDMQELKADMHRDMHAICGRYACDMHKKISRLRKNSGFWCHFGKFRTPQAYKNQISIFFRFCEIRTSPNHRIKTVGENNIFCEIPYSPGL